MDSDDDPAFEQLFVPPANQPGDDESTGSNDWMNPELDSLLPTERLTQEPPAQLQAQPGTSASLSPQEVAI